MRTCSLLRSLVAVALTGFAGFAQAAEEGKATFTFNLPGLTYASGTQESKVDGGTAAESKSTDMLTQDLNDSYAMLGFGNCVVYYYPFNNGKVLSFGYLPSSLYEVGLDIGLNSHKVDKPKEETDSTLIGIYAYVYPKLGKMDSEFGLIIDSVSEKGTSVTPASGTTPEVETKTNKSGLSEKIVANVIIPLRKNLNYVGGLFYKMSADEEKESKVKSSSSTFGLNLLTMRVTLD